MRSVYLLGLAALATACQSESAPPMEMGKDYYPLAVGAERVFDVVDSSWVNGSLAAPRRSQVREQLTEAYRDTTNTLHYKLVRSVRATSADAWRPDSVQVLTVQPRNLQLLRSNVRTVELLFPVRSGATWDKNAFNTLPNGNDPLPNRRLEDVGLSQTIGARTYAATATVLSFDALEGNIFEVRTLRQVYAKGVGPVLRIKRDLKYCEAGQNCRFGTIVQGQSHTETLRP